MANQAYEWADVERARSKVEKALAEHSAASLSIEELAAETLTAPDVLIQALFELLDRGRVELWPGAPGSPCFTAKSS